MTVQFILNDVTLSTVNLLGVHQDFFYLLITLLNCQKNAQHLDYH